MNDTCYQWYSISCDKIRVWNGSVHAYEKIRYLTHAYEKNKIPDVFSPYEKIKRYGTWRFYHIRNEEHT